MKTFTPASDDKAFVFSQLSKNIENATMKARRYNLAPRGVIIYLRSHDFRSEGLELKLSRGTGRNQPGASSENTEIPVLNPRVFADTIVTEYEKAANFRTEVSIHAIKTLPLRDRARSELLIAIAHSGPKNRSEGHES